MFSAKLRLLESKKLVRTINDKDSRQGRIIRLKNTEYINFSSNDYLGLAQHPQLAERAFKAIDKYGLGAGASRLLAGGTELHKELETKTAEFKNTPAALLLNSGYAANTGIIPALSGKSTVILSDELNHASIIDGCRLSRAEVKTYRHKDTANLEELLAASDKENKIVITDSVFSMDGDIAPLKEIFRLCKDNDALLYIDDAHGTGVLGNGRGALSHFDIKPEPRIVQMGTFSKALGSYGAFLACNSDITDWAINSARSFIFSTALPACIIAASLAALELITRDTKLIDRLWSNRQIAASELSGLGFDLMGSETPIIPLRMKTIEEALGLADSLFKNGIYAPAIRPPSVKEPRIRITITAAHTDKDIERLIETLRKI